MKFAVQKYYVDMSEKVVIWKKIKIPGFEKYEVSDDGTVRNSVTNRILKTEVNNGYVRIALAKPGMKHGSKHFMVHRLVAGTFIENDSSDKIHVNHLDGDKTNNCVSNLEWTTVSENISHSRSTGLKPAGGTPIIVTDCNGEVFEYSSQAEARKEIEIGENTILRALRQGTKPFGLTIEYKFDKHKKINIDLSKFEEVKNFPGYLIDKSGRVYGNATKKLLKIQESKNGYPFVSMCKNKKVTIRFLHTLLATQYIPNPDDCRVVNHIDHNKKNFDLNNLEWCTHKENTAKYLQRKKELSVLSLSEQSVDGSGENSEVEEKSD